MRINSANSYDGGRVRAVLRHESTTIIETFCTCCQMTLQKSGGIALIFLDELGIAVLANLQRIPHRTFPRTEHSKSYTILQSDKHISTDIFLSDFLITPCPSNPAYGPQSSSLPHPDYAGVLEPPRNPPRDPSSRSKCCDPLGNLVQASRSVVC